MNDDADRRGIGGNFPPEPVIERAEELLAATNRLLADHSVITDEDTAGHLDEFIKQLRKARADIERQEKREREPHDQAVANIRAKYRQPLQLLGICLSKAGALATDYLIAKQARLKREAEDRQLAAQEAQDRAERAADRAATDMSIEAELAVRQAAEDAEEAAALADREPDRARIKGDLSPTAMSLRAYWSAIVFDEPRALAHFADYDAVRQAALAEVKRLCNRLARELKDESKAPPGVRFIKTERAQ
jgi:hypothetical protein